jgi:hypothetical protein
MVVKEHEKTLVQLMVLRKLGPTAPEVHLTAAIIVHLHFIWRSSSRFFAEDSLTKLAPVHEPSKFQRNALLLTALSTSITKKEKVLTGGGGEALRGAVIAS